MCINSNLRNYFGKTNNCRMSAKFAKQDKAEWSWVKLIAWVALSLQNETKPSEASWVKLIAWVGNRNVSKRVAYAIFLQMMQKILFFPHLFG